MRFDPRDGSKRPYPSNSEDFRKYHGRVAWLFNPWTSKKRECEDIGTDPTGLMISH